MPTLTLRPSTDLNFAEINISELDKRAFDEFAAEMIGRKVEEQLRRGSGLDPAVYSSTALVAAISGLGELIKNSLDAGSSEITIRVHATRDLVIVDCEDRGTGFPSTIRLGPYKDTRSPDVTPPTPSTKSSRSSVTFTSSEVDVDDSAWARVAAVSPATSRASSTTPSRNAFLGGRGLGVNWMAKVVQGGPQGNLERLNAVNADGRVTGALVRFTSDYTPAKFKFSDIGVLEKEYGSLSPDDLNRLAPQQEGYISPGIGNDSGLSATSSGAGGQTTTNHQGVGGSDGHDVGESPTTLSEPPAGGFRKKKRGGK